MTNEEAVRLIEVAKAVVEWEYPLDYQIAFDKAIEALNECKAEKPTNPRYYASDGRLSADCPRCKNLLIEGQNTCDRCGKNIDWYAEMRTPQQVKEGEMDRFCGYYCPNCNEELVDGYEWKYCMWCGQALKWEEKVIR